MTFVWLLHILLHLTHLRKSYLYVSDECEICNDKYLHNTLVDVKYVKISTYTIH